MDRLKEIAVTFFYSGYAPVASGTAGSAGAVLLALLIPGSLHYGAACAAMTAAALAAGIPLGKWAEERWREKDPGPFVLDEVAGMFVALFRVNGGRPGLVELLFAFFVFRLFDVAKPPPARNLERLSGGLGIMLDDIVAGLYALAAVAVFRHHFYGLPF